MFTLAHFSDVHLPPMPRPRVLELCNKRIFGYLNWQRRRVHHRREVLDALVADVVQQNPSHIAITGDLTNIGLPEEFRRARDWLMSIGGADLVTVVPGNHDAYIPFSRDPGFRRWEPYISANVAGEAFMGAQTPGFPALRLFGDVALIGLSTAQPTPPFVASGRLGAEQLRALEGMLARLGEGGFCRVVLIHHPPLPGVIPWARALRDAAGLRDVLARSGAELVLYGHSHRAHIASLEGQGGRRIPVVGVSSASLASSHPDMMARYHTFTLARTDGTGWRVGMSARVFDASGQVTETARDLSPGAPT